MNNDRLNNTVKKIHINVYFQCNIPFTFLQQLNLHLPSSVYSICIYFSKYLPSGRPGFFIYSSVLVLMCWKMNVTTIRMGQNSGMFDRRETIARGEKPGNIHTHAVSNRLSEYVFAQQLSCAVAISNPGQYSDSSGYESGAVAGFIYLVHSTARTTEYDHPRQNGPRPKTWIQ